MIVGATGVALTPSVAQSISHDVSAAIPNSIGIRVVGAGTGTREVYFDFATDLASYVSAEDTGQRLRPTGVNRVDNIEVDVSGFAL